ncbi:hypothetical protein RBB50_012030 [Rhinocladiella similis]
MVFKPPTWVPELPVEPPSNVSIADFMLDERYGRCPVEESRAPFTCGLSGKRYSAAEMRDRVDLLARGISQAVGWSPQQGSEWDKIGAVFSFNTIDNLPLMWAIHRLLGVVCTVNPMSSVSELRFFLKASGCGAIFTSRSLLATTQKAAKTYGIPDSRIFIIEDRGTVVDGQPPFPDMSNNYSTLDDLIDLGKKVVPLPTVEWNNREGETRTAFLSWSSGTSGVPKAVMLSHKNVISQVLQVCTFESQSRGGLKQHVSLGLLPQSHIYGLTVICHASVYRGDEVIVLPRFTLGTCLSAVQRYGITSMFLVPPIIISMLRNQEVMKTYDLSSIKFIYSGAAPLAPGLTDQLSTVLPQCPIRQGYGLTESCGNFSHTVPQDVWLGSSGSLLPGCEAKLVSPAGREITTHGKVGELFIRSPSACMGYYKSPTETDELYQDGWMKTGDQALVRVSPNGHEHLFIVERIKELIKVKGFQVAPAELEAHLLEHPAVADAAVVGVQHDTDGEVPKAFIVRSTAYKYVDMATLARQISRHVEKHKAKSKRLKGGVEFVNAIPKNASGKILRRLLRDRERRIRAL